MGVCFGDSGYIEKTQKEDFKKLGISHVISVSGLHMSIVYKVLEIILGYKIAILSSFVIYDIYRRASIYNKSLYNDFCIKNIK